MFARPVLAFAISFTVTGSLAADPTKRVEAMSWLAGCWSMTTEESLIEELWLRPAGGSMLGLSRTIRNGRMTSYEYIAIREVNGTLAYVAKPSGQQEATFPLVRSSATELVFENPHHDFPQRISYRRLGDGIIAARVEGSKGGKSRAIDFRYERCP
jgi:hypothetical protein